MPLKETPVLKIRKLTKKYGAGCPICLDDETRVLEKNYCPHCSTVYACQNIDIDIYAGEIVGIVGESGSGKSTMMKCLYFDEEVTAGKVSLALKKGDAYENILTLSSQKKQDIQNRVFGMVYQNPYLGLTMDLSVIANVAKNMIASGNRHVGYMTEHGTNVLEKVNIPSFRIKQTPKTFSGGMQQRVQIAKALSNNPPILLLDEVTTGLDLSVQATVLDIIKKVQQEFGVSMIVVSHDLGVIRMLTQRTYVLLNGQVIEHGLTDQILEDPQHPYTQQLVYSML